MSTFAITISLAVSLCSGVSMSDVQKRVQELQKQHPEAKVNVRVSKKSCQ